MVIIKYSTLPNGCAVVSSSQAPVFIADMVDSSPIEYIFTYNGSEPLEVPQQCTGDSCNHTFTVTQVQQYNVSVAVRNVVGVGTASAPVTIGMCKLKT